uniref:FAD_binding_2 domain-containing protein n=1 Tax=Syphacia muris TaxID=451379 RepID=A0A0N5AZ59_9BILA
MGQKLAAFPREPLSGAHNASAGGSVDVALQYPDSHEPVIVVGGGLAGLSTSIEAYNNGASVILVEGEKSLGGNSAKASSGMAACNTEAQRTHNISDSTDLFYSDTMASGGRENDPTLVDVLVHDSAKSVQWLINLGVDLSDVNLCGGHSVKRVHWIPSPKKGRPIPVGLNIIRTLSKRVNEIAAKHPDKLKIYTGTEVIGLVTWNDFVTGVRVRNSSTNEINEINGKAVVLTTGGFSCDRGSDSLLAEFAPEKLSFPTTNGPWARGRGVKMARAMGAALVGMNRVQVHPTAFVDPQDPTASTKFLAAEALRGKGAILLNEKGERFGNELGRRDYLTGRILENCATNSEAGGAHVAYLLMTEQSADDFGRPAFNFYSKVKGLFKEDQFGKKVFPAGFPPDAPIYAAMITPAIHYTMGGLKIDKNAFVFNSFSDKPFKGLLAAGEVTGGVHGRNRLAGNSLLECVVYGRIAGQNAAKVHYTDADVVLNRSDL